MRLLITNASEAIAYKIKEHFKADFTVFTDGKDLPKLQTSNFKILPNSYQFESMVHQILAICLDEKLDAICPISALEAEVVCKNHILFEEYGIEILQNPFQN